MKVNHFYLKSLLLLLIVVGLSITINSFSSFAQSTTYISGSGYSNSNEKYLGNPIGANWGQVNIRIKDNKLSQHFTAKKTGTIEEIAFNIKIDEVRPGYQNGDCGKLHASIQASDRDGHPTGVELAYADNLNPCESHLPIGGGELMQLSTSVTVEGGERYHLVIENVDSNPRENWFSINIFWGRPDEYGGFGSYYNSVHWRRFTDDGNFGVLMYDPAAYYGPESEWGLNQFSLDHTPVFEVLYADGDRQGNSYIAVRSQLLIESGTSATQIFTPQQDFVTEEFYFFPGFSPIDRNTKYRATLTGGGLNIMLHASLADNEVDNWLLYSLPDMVTLQTGTEYSLEFLNEGPDDIRYHTHYRAQHVKWYSTGISDWDQSYIMDDNASGTSTRLFHQNADLSVYFAPAHAEPIQTDPTPLPTSPTNTPVSLPTNTPVSLPTNTPVSLPTNTPVSLPTNTPVSLPTNTPTPVNIATGSCSESSATIALNPENAHIALPLMMADGILYQPNTTNDVQQAGTALYEFNIAEPGLYKVFAVVDAQNGSTNSLFINIDNDLHSQYTIWDIAPTVGFEKRTLYYRGERVIDGNGIAPKLFELEQGAHQLVVGGREANTMVKCFYLELVNNNSGTTPVSTPFPSLPQGNICNNELYTIGLDTSEAIVSPPFEVGNDVLFQTVTTNNIGNAGQAVYEFDVEREGSYKIMAEVNAPNGSSNSIFINIDDPIHLEQTIWDIAPTGGFETRTLYYRGERATDGDGAIIPKMFRLSQGDHRLIVGGREANTFIKCIYIQYFNGVDNAMENPESDQSVSTNSINVIHLPLMYK